MKTNNNNAAEVAATETAAPAMNAANLVFYVTMIDKYFSGWGHAKGKKSKLVIVCDTLFQADTIYRNVCKKSKEMKYVNVSTQKPRNQAKYHLSWKTFDECPLWNKR